MRRADHGRRAPLPRRYRCLASFYSADSRRIHSRELDVGLWWRDQPDGPLHRAAWVSDTGELYLARLGPSEDGGGAVEVLATVPDRERLERVLSGWRKRCGEPRSLEWLRERAGLLAESAGVTRVMAAMTAEAARVGPLVRTRALAPGSGAQAGRYSGLSMTSRSARMVASSSAFRP
jgi:hypothetical protein